MSLFDRIPRNGRPAVVLIWLVTIILVSDQLYVFGHRVAKTWNQSGMDAVNSQGASLGAFIILLAITGALIIIGLNWCWHWTDREAQRNNRSQIRVVVDNTGPHQPA